nr:MAG TPA: hypothetical protein [Caudoviricetes sp.]
MSVARKQKQRANNPLHIPTGKPGYKFRSVAGKQR